MKQSSKPVTTSSSKPQVLDEKICQRLTDAIRNNDVKQINAQLNLTQDRAAWLQTTIKGYTRAFYFYREALQAKDIRPVLTLLDSRLTLESNEDWREWLHSFLFSKFSYLEKRTIMQRLTRNGCKYLEWLKQQVNSYPQLSSSSSQSKKTVTKLDLVFGADPSILAVCKKDPSFILDAPSLQLSAVRAFRHSMTTDEYLGTKGWQVRNFVSDRVSVGLEKENSLLGLAIRCDRPEVAWAIFHAFYELKEELKEEIEELLTSAEFLTRDQEEKEYVFVEQLKYVRDHGIRLSKLVELMAKFDAHKTRQRFLQMDSFKKIESAFRVRQVRQVDTSAALRPLFEAGRKLGILPPPERHPLSTQAPPSVNSGQAGETTSVENRFGL